jgi:Zn-dependent protease with chaperone function
MFDLSTDDAIRAVYRLLPPWVVWGRPVVSLAVGVIASAVAIWLCSRLSIFLISKTEPVSWVERARIAFTARRIVLLNGLASVVTFCVGVVVLPSISHVPPVVVAMVGSTLIWVIYMSVYWHVERRVTGEPLEYLQVLRSAIARILLFVPHLLLALTAIAATTDRFDLQTCSVVVCVGTFSLLVSVGYGLELLRVLGLARPARDRVKQVVARSAERVGVVTRGVFEVDWNVVNALVYPPSRRLVFTSKAIQLLSDADLNVICGHELGHLSEPFAIRWLRVSTVVGTTTLLVIVRPLAMELGVGMLAAALIGLFAWCFVIVQIARRMERRADAVAQANEAAEWQYACALESIYRHNLVPPVMGIRGQLHPELYDRLIAAGRTPDYLRPKPPRKIWSVIAIISGIAPFVALLSTGFVAMSSAALAPQDEQRQYIALVAGYAPGWCIDNLGLLQYDAGNYSEAYIYFRAGMVIDKESDAAPGYLALACLKMGRMDEAAAAVREARARGPNRKARDIEDWLDSIEQSINADRHRPAPQWPDQVL